MRFPSARIKIPTRFMALLRASCFPSVSQRSIWASQREAAAEGGYSATVHGVKSRRNCVFSLGKDLNSNSLHGFLRASCSPNSGLCVSHTDMSYPDTSYTDMSYTDTSYTNMSYTDIQKHICHTQIFPTQMCLTQICHTQI